MFERFKRKQNEETGFSSFENPSQALKETFEKAQQFPNPDPYSDDLSSMRPYLKEKYADHDRESYDCHSFTMAILRREFNLSSLPVLNFETPDRKDFRFETDWIIQSQENAENSPEYLDFHNLMVNLTTKIYKNSDHVAIHKIEPQDDAHGNETSASEAERKVQIQETMRQVIKRLTNASASRILLISNGHGEDFYDVHSSIILGLEKGGKDIFVLEKIELGSPVVVRRLSNVIEKHGLYSRHANLELSICRKPIKELLAT
jgi:hypothetical protein